MSESRSGDNIGPYPPPPIQEQLSQLTELIQRNEEECRARGAVMDARFEAYASKQRDKALLSEKLSEKLAHIVADRERDVQDSQPTPEITTEILLREIHGAREDMMNRMVSFREDCGPLRQRHHEELLALLHDRGRNGSP